VIASLAQYLNAQSRPQIGRQHALNAEYFRRIDALNFTMLHDDGQHANDLDTADVILTGIKIWSLCWDVRIQLRGMAPYRGGRPKGVRNKVSRELGEAARTYTDCALERL
jgi:hypothetical protein